MKSNVSGSIDRIDPTIISTKHSNEMTEVSGKVKMIDERNDSDIAEKKTEAIFQGSDRLKSSSQSQKEGLILPQNSRSSNRNSYLKPADRYEIKNPAKNNPKYHFEDDNEEEEGDILAMLEHNAKKKNDSSKNKKAETEQITIYESAEKSKRSSKSVFFNAENFKGRREGKLTDHYVLYDPPLGSGIHGSVHRGLHKETKVFRAIKKIKRSLLDNEEKIDHLLRDFNILKTLNHSNIIQVFEFYVDEEYVSIVTEYCAGGELFDLIIEKSSFTENDAATYFIQMVSAIAYCHQKKLVHCDLKPENIVLPQKGIKILKIIDFGSAAYVDKNKLTEKFGTVYYIAPEVLKGSYDEKCDIWSLGVILYVMLSGKPPFGGNTDNDILYNVRNSDPSYSPTRFPNTSPLALDLLRKMLERDTGRRLSCEDVMKHPWVQSHRKPISSSETPIAKESLRSLRHFRGGCKLGEAILTYISVHMLTNEETLDLTNQFMILDTDHDGKISLEDLVRVYSNMGKDPRIVDSVVKEIMIEVENVSGEACISYNTFLTLMVLKTKLINKESLAVAFSLFDYDRDGKIPTEELRNVLGKGALSLLHPDELMSIWTENDLEGKKEIDLEDFTKLIEVMSKSQNLTQSLSQNMNLKSQPYG